MGRPDSSNEEEPEVLTAHPRRKPTFSEVIMPLIRYPFLSKLSLKKILTLPLALCLLLILTPTASWSADAESPPLPADLKIEAPAPDVPAEISNFLGVWEGRWKARGRSGRGIPLVLAVEKVQGRKAGVVLSLGKDPGQRFSQGWRRQDSVFSELSGRLELPVVLTSTDPVQKVDINFFINNKGNLEGRLFGMLAFGYYTADIELSRRPGVFVSKPSPSSAGASKGLERQPTVKFWKGPKDIIRGSFGGGSGVGGMLDVRALSVENRSTEDVLYNDGVDYINKGEYGKAVSKFKEVLESNPKNSVAIFNCGLAYALAGRYDLALGEFNKYLTSDRKDPDAYYDRALVYVQKGQFDQALADINSTIGAAPNNAQAYYLRGFIHLKKKELNPSRTDYQKASQLDPGFVRMVRKDKSELGQYALILEGKKEPPWEDKEHRKKGKTLAQHGEYAQALSEMDQALALNPKDAETYTRRGGIYTLQKQYDKAISDFNRALELNPRSAKAYYNRALAYYYQRKYDQALADLQKTLELKPKDAAAYHNRGLVYTQKNDFAKAIDDFNTAIALNPQLADAYFNKAATCERAGRREEAQEAYAAYLKVAPPEAKAQIDQAQSRLGQARQGE
jgi:tetratricopeptide (TPR) repeat protein